MNGLKSLFMNRNVMFIPRFQKEHQSLTVPFYCPCPSVVQAVESSRWPALPLKNKQKTLYHIQFKISHIFSMKNNLLVKNK